MAQAKKAPPDGPEDRRSKSLYLMLGGLIAAGAIAWWRWLRSLPKD